MQRALLIESTDQVEHIFLNRPDTLNALDDELTEQLLAYFEGLQDRPEVRLVVLKGLGKGFCSGLDLKSAQAQSFIEGGPVDKLRVQRRLRNIIVAMRRCPQPIIAVLHGVAAGGGLSLALAADIRIAAANARINAAFIRIGLGGADIGSSYLLPRLIGAAPAFAILLTGRMLDAPRAYELGLIAALTEESKLDELAETFVRDMLSTGPLALRMTKEVLNINLDAPGLEAALALEDRNQVILGQTENFSAAITSFMQKQPPTFTPEGDRASEQK